MTVINISPLVIAILVLSMVAFIKLIKGRFRPAILLGFIALGLVGGLFLGKHATPRHATPRMATSQITRPHESDAEWHARQAEIRALNRQLSKMEQQNSRFDQQLDQQIDHTTQARVNEGNEGNEVVVVKAECESPVDFQDPEIEIQLGPKTVTKAEARQAVREIVAEISSHEDFRELVSKGRKMMDNARAILHEADDASPTGDAGPAASGNSNQSNDELAEARPAWVDDLGINEHTWQGSVYRTHRIVPGRSSQELEGRADQEFADAVADYNKFFRDQNQQYADSWFDGQEYVCLRRSVRDACIVDTFDTRESTILGDDLPMRHLLVEFDGIFQRQVEGHYEKVHSLARTTQAGTGAAGLLGILAAVFGYLKLDEATNGQRRGRLKLAALAAVAVLALGIFVLASWLPAV